MSRSSQADPDSVRSTGAAAARTGDADPETVARFTARLADRPGWWVRTLGIAGGTATAVLGVGFVALGHLLAGGVLAVLAVAGTAWAYRVGRPRTFAVTEPGLVWRGRVRPWDRLTGYAVTEDAIVVYGEGRFEAVRIDRGDLSDPDAVVALLADRLPESG